ncbi:MAG: TetR/AcrR family transcriptional regulator [Myxococcales bacterium]|nr:TetR/AcrR family transcriptional regulator [Myxococcales bacterium]
MALRTVSSGPEDSGSGVPNRRQQQRIETRERIFEASLEEFRMQGFSNAQIDRIVERAGVARGTFYFHFPTKEHVLIEAQRRRELDVMERLNALGPPPASVTVYLTRVLESILAGLEEDAGLRREIMTMYLRGSVNLELAAEPLIVAVVDYFADAAERGAIRSDVPPELLAVRFLSSLYTLVPAGKPDPAEQRDAIKWTVELFVHGVSA